MKPTAGSPFFGAFPSERIPKATKMSGYVSLLTGTIPIYYTSEFQESLEATTYLFLTLLKIRHLLEVARASLPFGHFTLQP